jgi:hypothetical protein
MTTDNTIARLYQAACRENARLLADVDAADLIDLAEGRLVGDHRARLVDAIAASPSLAAAYRLARASRGWSQALAAEMADEAQVGSNVRALPARQARPAATAPHRRSFAMAAAVGAMAVGAVFVSQRLQSPAEIDAGFAENSATEDGIMAGSFGSKSDDDVIFSVRNPAEQDRIFAFGKGS